MLRAILVLAVACSGGCAPKISMRTNVSKASAVIDVKPDAAQGSAWVTFRDSITTSKFIVTERQGTDPRKVELDSKKTIHTDRVWLCQGIAGDKPRCVQAEFDFKARLSPAAPATPAAP